MKKPHKAASTKAPETVRTFEIDNRRTNPTRHNFCVRGAYEDLRLAKEAIDVLEARSRVPASMMAAALHTVMVEEIEVDATERNPVDVINRLLARWKGIADN